MIHTVAIPPDAQMAPLMRGYAASVSVRRRQMVLGAALALFAFLLACLGAEVDLAKFWANLGNFGSYFYRISRLDTGAFVWTDPVEWYWGLGRWLRLLAETLLMAYLGTATGFVGGFVACFLCSRNLVARAWVRFAVRRALEFCRTVPDIVFALIFVIAFGLGPLPGVLAIAIHTSGALGKLFSEVVESIDMKPVEGIAASGGSWVEQIRFGVLPQVLSNFASYGILRFEVNVRGATVLGFVGAGGIGEELLLAIRKFFYSDVSAILLLVAICVMAIDLVSEHIRHRLLTMEGGKT